MDSPKVIVRRSPIAGTGVFSVDLITPGEIVASFDGPFYALDYPGWSPDLINHAIQCGRDQFRDSLGLARLVNHSCEPNCGIQRLFDIAAMRVIEPGEEITWDYEMTEDSDWWRMPCHCGTASCRKIIGAYRNLPEGVRMKYRGFISEWLSQAEGTPKPFGRREHGPLQPRLAPTGVT
jgi:uncharacterized protein